MQTISYTNMLLVLLRPRREPLGLMKTNVLTTIIGAAMLWVAASAQAEVSPQLIKDLNEAFQGESNASNRYALFAQKAEKDGYPDVARLFRATSASEAIHRDEHKQAILKLGGQVEEFQLEAVTPGTTAENLEAAIKGETYENAEMYPKFMALAEKEDARPAMRTLRFAMETEEAHAQLYRAALDNLGKQGPVDYYVCQVCGMTVTELPAEKCKVCRKPVDEYKKIS